MPYKQADNSPKNNNEPQQKTLPSNNSTSPRLKDSI